MVPVEKLMRWFEGEVGTREYPYGSNFGKRVGYYQSATGAYRAPWCVSLIQKGLQVHGIGPIFERTAGVFYFVSRARRYGLTYSRPKRGYAVAFMNGLGHIGMVKRVLSDGSFITCEGNHNHMVAEVHRPARGNYVFVKLPQVDYGAFVAPKPKPRWKWVPRFQIVTAHKSNPKVIAAWNKWTVVGPRIPKLLAAGRTFQVKRKMVRVRA